jgi:hypothetical protein
LRKQSRPEDRVERDLDVVVLAPVEVHVERPVVGEQLAYAREARDQEGLVVGERVCVGVVAAALVLAGVERRVA